MDQHDERQSAPVSNFGEQARLRRERLRINQDELAEQAGVHRDTVSAIEHGGGGASSKRKVDAALSEMEAEAGFTAEPLAGSIGEAQQPAAPHVVRIKVEGVYGAKALVVEGPVDDLPALEAAVDRIMRRLANEGGGARERPTDE